MTACHHSCRKHKQCWCYIYACFMLPASSAGAVGASSSQLCFSSNCLLFALANRQATKFFINYRYSTLVNLQRNNSNTTHSFN